MEQLVSWIFDYELLDDLVLPRVSTYREGAVTLNRRCWVFKEAIKTCVWTMTISCLNDQQLIGAFIANMIKVQFSEELGHIPPKTRKECLELARDFIKAKKSKR